LRFVGAAVAVLLVTAAGAAWAAETCGVAAPSQDARPGDDFYLFVNGPWLRATTIPAGRASFDTTAALRLENAGRVEALIRAAAAGTLVEGQPETRRLARLIGDAYASQADDAAIEAAGLKPLQPELAAIAAIEDRRALAAALGRSLALDDGTDTQVPSLFGLWVHQGFHDPDHYAAHLTQGGLGLADRDAYLADTPQAADLRARYLTHLTAMLRLAGQPDPDRRAARVLALETAIARSHASRADTDDVFKTDNTWRRADFAARAPGLDWAAFFGAAGLDGEAQFVVWQPSAVTGAAALAADQPLESWKDYLTARLIERAAPALPRALAQEHLSLVNGLPTATPSLDREALAITAVNAGLGEAVGRLYVERRFPRRAKAAATEMVENIRLAYRTRLAAASWMSPKTRALALAKLDAVQVGLGYPDRWTSYAGLSLVRGEAYANQRRIEQFDYRRSLAKLRVPVDPGEWAIAPQSVNASINFSPNSLQFSAGLLQPPFFDPVGDPAANYGSAGAGIAHEIWHSFDELGRIWDAQGRLGAWQTPAEQAAYAAAAAPLARQYDAYCPQPGLCVRGAQVLGESVGDLIGLTVAVDAYRLSGPGVPDTPTRDLIGEQRLFCAYAQRWRRAQTDAALARQVAADAHAPGAYRAAAVRNLDAWYDAFAVPPDARLYLKPEDRVRLP
jgi:predicted metalloendopeptidase